MNRANAEALYNMRGMQFDSFVDFLKVNPCDSRQTTALIILDFFSEFGKSQKLLDIYDLYTQYNGKKQISKDKCTLPVNIVAKYSTETEKMYKITDIQSVLLETIDTIPNKNVPMQTLLDTQRKILGYIDYINPDAVKYGYVTDVDTKYTPKLTVYKLDTGETITVKISKRDFAESEIDENTLMKFTCKQKSKCRKENGKWINIPNEYDLWIDNFKIVK